jgi:hypothetical protein
MDTVLGVVVIGFAIVMWGVFSVMGFTLHREDGHSKLKSAFLAPLLPFQLIGLSLIQGGDG